MGSFVFFVVFAILKLKSAGCIGAARVGFSKGSSFKQDTLLLQNVQAHVEAVLVHSSSVRHRGCRREREVESESAVRLAKPTPSAPFSVRARSRARALCGWLSRPLVRPFRYARGTLPRRPDRKGESTIDRSNILNFSNLRVGSIIQHFAHRSVISCIQ